MPAMNRRLSAPCRCSLAWSWGNGGRRVGRRGSLRSRPRAPACARARRTGAAPHFPRTTPDVPEPNNIRQTTSPATPICPRSRNAVNLLPCAGLPIRYRRAGLPAARATFRVLCASNNLLLAAPQACVAKASISTSSVPQGRLRCVPDERVPGRQGVRVARLRESQSARSCCRCRSGFSCRRIRACHGWENRAGTERNTTWKP